MKILSFELLVPAVLAAISAVLLTPPVRRLARQTGAIAYPKDDRWHTRPVPTLGGVAILCASSLAFVLSSTVDTQIVPLLVAGLGMFLIGVTDDFLHLQPGTKLTGQIAVACVVMILGYAPMWTGWQALDVLLGILWIVTVTNAPNLLDNMDGLCAGIAALAAFACTVDLLSASPHLAAYAAAVGGAC